MTYQNIYNDIITRGTRRGLDKKKLTGYYEKHHIVPKCLGGLNDKANLVLLTGREHFIVHRLLVKMHKGNKSLFFAVYQMSIDKTKNRDLGISSRTYELLKKQFSLGQRGKNNPACRPEIRKKMSDMRIGQVSFFKGKKHTEEAKRAMSVSSSVRCKGEGNSRYGVTLTDETKKKISDSLTGRTSALNGIPRTKEDCRKIAKGIQEFYLTDKGADHRAKIGTRIKSYNIRPWQTPRARASETVLALWAKADVLYTLWIENNKPKEVCFSNIYNTITGYPERPSRFKNILKKFIAGWVPIDDPDWVAFSTGATFEPNPCKDIS